MNKTAIKNFAIWARGQLIESAKQKAYEYEITENGENMPVVDAIGGRLLTKEEKEQRSQLIEQIRRKGYAQVMEEVAYTWFNRFIALRFMEVNGYLPSKVRVFTDEDGSFKPEIMKQAMSVELDGLDRSRVFDLLDKQDNEELFKYLIITQCNDLSGCLPYMFERIANWTELLFPANLLRSDSVIGQMVTEIPEEDWTDAVQIIGWLYQYYNSELKDDTFAKLKKNIKISKERIPAATQLFTPDWIVRYMVENSLGRLWYEGHNDFDKLQWKYYLDKTEQEPEVEEQLQKIRAEYANLKPEDIKVIDPCMGSGHILVYAFEVLMQIYTSSGWSERDAARSILENNLFGLDIDDRAGQLAYFAVMMKARKYNRRILNEPVRPKVISIQESNGIDINLEMLGPEKPVARKLIGELKDAKEYGSILNLSVTQEELDALKLRLKDIDEMSSYGTLLTQYESERLMVSLHPLIELVEVMIQKYDVVITNPPYMGASGMPCKLSEFVKRYYPDSKSDLFAVFIERCGQMTKRNGYQAMITQHAWMFLAGFERVRSKLLLCDTINMVHLGARAFEEIGGAVVQTTSFVLQRQHISKRKGIYYRLLDAQSETGKEQMFLKNNNRFISSSDNFTKVPGCPISYWVSENIYRIFDRVNLERKYDIKAGMCTGDNAKYILYWHEVDWTRSKVASSDDYDYSPHNKGGEYRKWYGNRDFVLKYSKKALTAMESNVGFRHDGKNYYFKEHIGWSKITSGASSFRYYEKGFTFDSAGLGLFPVATQNIYVTLAFLNSKVAEELIALLNPTLNVTPMVIKQLPFTEKSDAESAVEIAKENIQLCRADWDSFENSWDFKRHPLV